VPGAEVRRFLEALIDHPEASKQLKARAETAREAFAPSAPRPRRTPAPRTRGKAGKMTAEQIEKVLPPAVPNPQPFVPGRPAFRTLRGYSIDPALTTKLETAPISQVTFKVPWETLKPGPVGEYLEVIDFDPASGCFYEPVDLDHPSILAQDGLAPSEGTPQFHQQMVYAVASLTIKNFERALGRRSLWSPRRNPPGLHPKNDSYYVQRLRIYPHALREQNAYYSPVKVGLLFGYFRAEEAAFSDHVPGGMIFSCLSHDIIAHEVTHALLDGLRARLAVPSGPDVPAFHEAFADIVAIFQHFTHEDVVLAALQKSGGRIRYASLLTDLAAQFGHTTGSPNALRSAIDPTETPLAYDRVVESHQRGSSLVTAVFEAFTTVFERKTRRYLRLATGGSGILPPGDLPDDLKRVLAEEAAKLARQFLNICIRAVDYCPPVDLELGEYLRAIITADHDLVTDDPWGYREAFIDAFRRRRIFPPDVRNLGEDALLWDAPASPIQRDELNYSRLNFVGDPGRAVGPQERLDQATAIGRLVTRLDLREQFGLCPPDAKGMSAPRVHSVRTTRRVGPDGQILFDLVAEVTQRREAPLGDGAMEFFGGCTVIFGPEGDVRYIVRKHATSDTRWTRQRDFADSAEGRRLWERSGDVVQARTAMLFRLLDTAEAG
jgi:hypothetical protein